MHSCYSEGFKQGTGWVMLDMAFLGRPDFVVFVGKGCMSKAFGQNWGTPKQPFLPPPIPYPI